MPELTPRPTVITVGPLGTLDLDEQIRTVVIAFGLNTSTPTNQVRDVLVRYANLMTLDMAGRASEFREILEAGRLSAESSQTDEPPKRGGFRNEGTEDNCTCCPGDTGHGPGGRGYELPEEAYGPGSFAGDGAE